MSVLPKVKSTGSHFVPWANAGLPANWAYGEPIAVARSLDEAFGPGARLSLPDDDQPWVERNWAIVCGAAVGFLIAAGYLGVLDIPGVTQ